MRSNQLRLYFSSFAYILVHGLCLLGLEGTELAKAQCDTIRLKLFKIGAQIRVSVRKVWISFSLSASRPVSTGAFTAPTNPFTLLPQPIRIEARFDGAASGPMEKSCQRAKTCRHQRAVWPLQDFTVPRFFDGPTSLAFDLSPTLASLNSIPPRYPSCEKSRLMIPPLRFLHDYSWFVGFATGGGACLGLMWCLPVPSEMPEV